MKTLILKSILLILIFSGYSIAQQKDIWTTFTRADGLTDNRVNAILESSDGALWFGTSGGVSRYQHLEWTTFNTDNSELAHNDVNAIYESSDGALWLGTNGGGVSRCQYQEDVWETFDTTNTELADNEVMAIIESDGAMWFGTYGGGVSRYQDEEWQTFRRDNTNNGLVSNNVTTIIRSSDGALWFGTAKYEFASNDYIRGVSRYQKGTWTTFTTDNTDGGLTDGNIQAILESSDGALWFGTNDGGVSRYQYQEDIWTTFDIDSGLADNDVKAICESSDEVLWFGTEGGGVSRYQNGKWKTITDNNGLIDNKVRVIIESNDGALWFGTTGGASRYEEAIWITFTTEHGLADNIVWAIIESSDGALWFGTDSSGVSRYQDEDWTTYNTNNSKLVHNGVNAILESREGALWFATDGGGISRYRNEEWTPFTRSNTNGGLVNNYVNAITESSDGALWFGCAGSWEGPPYNLRLVGGVSRYQNNVWRTFDTDNGLAYNHVNAILESSDGALWFGTGRGVSKYQGGVWTTFTTATTDSMLASDWVWAIHESKDGALWFGTSQGVSKYHEGYWETFPSDDGLADNDVRSIIESRDGDFLWFGTYGEGINWYKNDEEGGWGTFRTTDGLASDWITTIIESGDGKLWIGTWGGGVSRFKPDKIPPKTTIDDGPENNETIGTSRPLFKFKGYDFRTELGKLSYSWVVFDMRNSLVVDCDSLYSYTACQPTIWPINGTYTFSVRARDEWGNIDPTPATRKFIVDLTPPTVVITDPTQEQHIKDEFTIIGSAFDNSSPSSDFDNYNLKYGVYISDTQEPEWQDDRFSNLDSNEVRDGSLGIFNTVGLEDGNYQIRLWASDDLGHTSEDKVQVTIDNTVPKVRIISPKPDDTVKDIIEVRAAIIDTNINKYQLDYRIENQTDWQKVIEKEIIHSIIEDSLYSWQNKSDSGNVQLKLTCWDKAGNDSSDLVQFLLDNPYPKPTATISKIVPSKNKYLNGIVSIIGFAKDPNFTQYTITLKGQDIDTLLIESDTQKDNEELYGFDTRSFPDGNYTLSLMVMNSKQYKNEFSISIVIDNTDPMANLTYPSQGDTISCIVQVQGEWDEINLQNITLKYVKFGEKDTSNMQPDTIDTTSFSFFKSWNTMDLDGNYDLVSSIEDKGGLRIEEHYAIYIDNKQFEADSGLQKNQDEFSLYIPPNGYESSVICLEKKSIDGDYYDPNVIETTGLIVEIHSSSDKIEFTKNKPGILTIDYSDLDLSKYNENNLSVFKKEDNEWNPNNLIGGTLDKDNKTIATIIKKIGIYGLFEIKGVIQDLNIPLQLTCQPRIFSPQGNLFNTEEVAISFALSNETNVTIKIYNAAGRLVRVIKENESLPPGNNVVYWDGMDKWDKFCASGLYILTIEAENKMATKTFMVLNE